MRVVTLVVLLAAAVPFFLWLRGRTRAPTEAAAAAAEAVALARSADAATWAPATLANAESSLRTALAQQRAQAVRFFVLRDYGAVRGSFLLAQSQAYEAASAARQQSAQSDQDATTLLERAARAVDTAEQLSRQIPLERPGRQHLRRAQSQLAEARFYLERGDSRQAQELASQAIGEAERAAGHATDLAARFLDDEQVRTWQRWTDETIATSRRTGGAAIIVMKEKHLLTLYVAGEPVRSYLADMGQNRLNDKLRAGDQATPEGRYFITVKKGLGRSRYYRALELDYPNASDLRRFESARRAGQISGAGGPGRLIEIHGEGGRGWDWTDGCIALSNRDMDDLYARVQAGTPVTIVGGEGSGGVFSEALRGVGEGGQIP